MNRRDSSCCLALVCDHVRTEFDRHVWALGSLHSRLKQAGCVVSTDLYLAKRTVLLTILEFTAEKPPLDLLRAHFTRDESPWIRVLDLSALSTEQLERFYSSRLHDVEWQREAVGDLADALAALHSYLLPLQISEDQTTTDRIDLNLDIEIESAGVRHAAVLESISLDSGTIRAEVAPPLNENVLLSLPTSKSDYLLELRACVAKHASPGEHGDTGGARFDVDFLSRPSERALFESFLVAQARCVSWPGRSGRRHERFPVRMRVEYAFGGAQHREQVCNLGRGGLFVESETPPPKGAEILVHLLPQGDGQPISLKGCVVHCRKGMVDSPGGIGIEFSDGLDVVDQKLKSLFGQSGIPSSRRAMIVDDDRFFREVVGGAFRMAGFEVVDAADGTEAIQKLIDELLQLDVLVLDLFMPGMTGVDVLQTIRRLGGEQDLIIVVLTGSELTNDDRMELKAFGANGVLPKSTDPSELVSYVSELIALQRDAETDTTLPLR